MKVTLKKPLAIGEGEGKKTITEIDFDFDKLTGADYLFCSREAGRKNGSPIVYFQLDDSFRLEVMARASGLEAEVFPKLHISDFAEVDSKVRSFLMGLDSA